MGGCVSRVKGSIGISLRSSKKSRKRRREFRRRVSFQKPDESLDKIDKSGPRDHCYSNSTLQGYSSSPI